MRERRRVYKEGVSQVITDTKNFFRSNREKLGDGSAVKKVYSKEERERRKRKMEEKKRKKKEMLKELDKRLANERINEMQQTE